MRTAHLNALDVLLGVDGELVNGAALADVRLPAGESLIDNLDLLEISQRVGEIGGRKDLAVELVSDA